MKDGDFQELIESVRQAGRIRRGEKEPSRRFEFAPVDVKAIRARLGVTQREFALMIGVSVATLRNWEQGRRMPEGPARALLKVAAENPEAVAAALLEELELPRDVDRAEQQISVGEGVEHQEARRQVRERLNR
jgi:putative transcriptional regulator